MKNSQAFWNSVFIQQLIYPGNHFNCSYLELCSIMYFLRTELNIVCKKLKCYSLYKGKINLPHFNLHFDDNQHFIDLGPSQHTGQVSSGIHPFLVLSISFHMGSWVIYSQSLPCYLSSLRCIFLFFQLHRSVRVSCIFSQSLDSSLSTELGVTRVTPQCLLSIIFKDARQHQLSAYL